MKIARMLLVMLFVCGVANAQKAEAIKSASSTTAIMAPAKVDPVDQLEVVRLSAEIVDVQAQIQAAEIHKALSEKLRDLSVKQQQVLETIKAKLPKPDAGKEWEPRPDGKYGVTFVQIEIPKPKPEDKPKP